MVYDITLMYQRTVCFFTAVFESGFCLKLQSVAMMASSRKCLLEDEIEHLLEELTASDQSSCSHDDDSSGTDDMTVVEVLGSECSDSESGDVQCATASSATFTWEDMTNYVGQREQFVDKYGPQNEAQNETHCAKVFKMFFDDELVELIVRETNTYAAQKIQARSSIPLRSRMRDWKPVTKDKVYGVLALFMLMAIIQKPTLHSYFSKKLYFGDSNLWFYYFYGSV